MQDLERNNHEVGDPSSHEVLQSKTVYGGTQMASFSVFMEATKRRLQQTDYVLHGRAVAQHRTSR